MNIPFLNLSPAHLSIATEMQTAFKSVYDNNWFILGERVKQFEKEYAEFNRTRFAIGTSNGLDALTLCLLSLGIKEGDEVIVPSNTFIASVLAVSFTRATPVFVEPDTRTYNLDPSRLVDAINDRTKVIMPVHLYGQACEMHEIMKIAGDNALFVIEDNAQAHGSSFDGKLTGSWGHINATSFYPGKNLGALGDGGAITTDDEVFAAAAKKLQNYGSAAKYQHEIMGFNMRLDEMQAAFLSVKLQNLEKWTAERKKIASWYDENLSKIGDLILPFIHPKSDHVFHLYVVRTSKRDELRKHLKDKGIGTLVHYPIPPHLQKAYEHLGYAKGDFPIAEELAQSSLSLPLWPGMTEQHVEYIAAQIKSYFEAHN
ncbi:MAG: DegT/DnrJ/EryC1/StrS family aminotransferase [Bacteroidota bacterium]